LFVDSGMMKCLYRRLQRKEPSRYKVIQSAITSEDWPPIGQVTEASANMAASVAISMEASARH
jgi:hypothetical protein